MAPAVNDDLDLDGNWIAADDDDAEDVAGQVSSSSKLPRGKKRKSVVAGVAAASTLNSVSDVSGSSKKKKKQKQKKLREVYSAEQLVGEGDARSRACERVARAWVAEGKCRSLAPLEVKEFVPRPEWFLPCSLDSPLVAMPEALEGSAARGGVLAALRMKAAPGSAKPRSAGVVVLCSSSEQVFAVLPRLEKAWGTKPLPLCTFGGGRRKDQIHRQGQSLQAGVAVVIGTPGRVLRLLDEGELVASGFEVLVLDLALDRKQRDVLTLPETRRDVLTLLQKHLRKLFAAAAGPRLVLCGAAV